MNSVATLIKRIATVPAQLFLESLPLLREAEMGALVPAVEADRGDLVRMLVLYEPQQIQRAIQRAKTPEIHSFLSRCLQPHTEEYFYVNQAAWFRAAHDGNVGFISEMARFYMGKRNPDVDPEHRNKTALHEAVCGGQTQTAALLLAEQRQPWKNGKTALMMAAEAGNAQLCQLLQQELGCQDQYGWNALMYAVDGRHISCLQWLRQEFRQRNAFKMTALDIAKQRAMGDVAVVLQQLQEIIE